MKQAVEIEVGGLKCDAVGCDYYDHDARYEDYEKYVNNPCPKCGANLLTEADLKTCQIMMAAAGLVNAAVNPNPTDPVVRVSMHMDGSGEVKPEVIGYE
jgi:hypothetical protein